MPLVIFNLTVAVVVYFVQAYQILDHDFSKQLYPINLSVWIDAILGLYSSPINYPLNFLRDLYILSLLAPVFGYILRQYTWLGLLVCFCLFWFNFDGSLILRNTMPIVFYLGGMVAVKNWDLRKLDNYAVPLFGVFLVLCIGIVFFTIENRNYLRIISPFLIWPAASLLVNSKPGMWLASLAKYSFLTFLAHGPLLLIAYFLYMKFFTVVPYWIFWLAAPLTIAIVVVQSYKLLKKFAPKTTNFLLGGR